MLFLGVVEQRSTELILRFINSQVRVDHDLKDLIYIVDHDLKDLIYIYIYIYIERERERERERDRRETTGYKPFEREVDLAHTPSASAVSQRRWDNLNGF